MPKTFAYAVLGAGQQGASAAYDLARFGDASQVVLADADLKLAQAAAKRVAGLLPKGAPKIVPAKLDARSPAALARLLRGRHGVLSCLPYYLNPAAAAAAIAARVPYADLGGHFDTTLKIQALHKKAQKAGIALLPDCGISPGTCNILAAAGIARLDKAEEVHMYCGGLPEHPRPPLGYKLVFNLEGVLGNYFGVATVLRDGEIAEDQPLARRQIIDFPNVGRLEAAVTGGATATAPWTWKGKLRAYDYKTLRWPGHWDKIEALRDLGLFEEKPVKVDGKDVSPRKVFVAAAEGRLKFPDDRDLLIQRVIVIGTKDGKPARCRYDLLDRFDPATGFTAMQRTTGFTAAAVLHLLARGRVKGTGVLALEAVVPPFEFLEEIRKRGIPVDERVISPDAGEAA